MSDTIVTLSAPPTIIVSPQQGPPGIAGTGAADKVNFAYGDASPANLLLIQPNFVLYEIHIVLLTAFNGDPSTVTIGDTGDNARLLSSSQIDLGSAGTYIVSPNYKYLSTTQVNLYISLGAGVTQGNGIILLYKTLGN